ncbi:hypothetical protein OG21DRAFT_1518123 [Imleria badia]|nr:hypothetical protein OG21DRAFT_1518123 [Imleria badia]
MPRCLVLDVVSLLVPTRSQAVFRCPRHFPARFESLTHSDSEDQVVLLKLAQHRAALSMTYPLSPPGPLLSSPDSKTMFSSRSSPPIPAVSAFRNH